MSRDRQVRVVFCDWMAWLLRMKRCEHDNSLKSPLNKRRTRCRCSIEDASPLSDTHLSIDINKVSPLSYSSIRIKGSFC